MNQTPETCYARQTIKALGIIAAVLVLMIWFIDISMRCSP